MGWVLAICAVGCTILVVALYDRYNRDIKARQLREDSLKAAESFASSGMPLDALYSLSHLVDYRKDPRIPAMVGKILDLLKRPDLAALAYGDARSLCYGPNCPYIGLSIYHNMASTYFWMEAYAFASAENWEFAFLRSNQALYEIERGKFPRMNGNHDIESSLRVVRMMSAPLTSKIDKKHDLARSDAKWIIMHSKAEDDRNLAISILNSMNNLEDSVKMALNLFIQNN